MIGSKHGEEQPVMCCPESAGHLTLDGQPDETRGPRQTSTNEEPNPRLMNAYEHIPPDGGWGWVVLAASGFVLAIMAGTSNSFGVLFSSKMGHLGASATTVSWIFSVGGIIFSVGIGVTDTLTERFGHRPVLFICSMVTSLSFMLLAFTNSSLAGITVLYGVIIPMSSGIVSTVPFLIVPLNFERRRGRAMAALITGGQLGGIVLPLLLRGLLDHYGFSGAVLIHGALMSHCCVAAALCRPVISARGNKTVCPEKFPIDEQKEDGRRKNSYSLRTNNMKSSEDAVLSQELNNEISGKQSRQDQNDILEVSIQDDAENQFPQTNIREHQKHNLGRQCGPLHNQLRTLLRKTLAILNQRQLILLGLCHALTLISHINLVMLVPFALEFSGHSSQVSARALSVSALANLVTRLVVAFVADCKWFNRRLVLILGLCIVTLFTFVFSLVTTSLPGVLVSMVGVGVGVGLAMSVVYTVMLDLLGLKLYAKCFGVSAILEAVIYITLGPAIGALRDWSGSYGWSICACAVLQLCSALLLLPLPCAQAHDSKSGSRNNTKKLRSKRSCRNNFHNP